MVEPTLQQHLKKIASSGGKALVRKRGNAYMKKLVKSRWAKQKAKTNVKVI